MVVKTGAEPMGKVVVDVKLNNQADRLLADRGHLPASEVRTTTIKGVVDTGAAMLVLPESAVKALGLPKDGETTVRYADHRKATRDIVGELELEMFGRRFPFKAVVEPGRSDASIGAIVLEALDLLVDCRQQVLRPRDPDIICTEIE